MFRAPRRLVAAIPVAIVLTVLAGCQSSGLTPAGERLRVARQNLPEVARYLSGSFTSERQAAGDPQNYRDIRLHVSRVWPQRDDGIWLYVEQAVASAADRPYRQRVYHLTACDDGRVKSDIYELPGDSLRFAGAWRAADPLAGLSPEDLALRDGCGVYLKRQSDGTYVGGTEGRGCASTFGGAQYVTTEVTLTPGYMVSWDRGFDGDGKQVWGATQGGYVFERVREPMSP